MAWTVDDEDDAGRDRMGRRPRTRPETAGIGVCLVGFARHSRHLPVRVCHRVSCYGGCDGVARPRHRTLHDHTLLRWRDFHRSRCRSSPSRVFVSACWASLLERAGMPKVMTCRGFDLPLAVEASQLRWEGSHTHCSLDPVSCFVMAGSPRIPPEGRPHSTASVPCFSWRIGGDQKSGHSHRQAALLLMHEAMRSVEAQPLPPLPPFGDCSSWLAADSVPRRSPTSLSCHGNACSCHSSSPPDHAAMFYRDMTIRTHRASSLHGDNALYRRPMQRRLLQHECFGGQT